MKKLLFFALFLSLSLSFSQQLFFRTGFGPAAYGDPGDGLAFTSEAGWSYRRSVSIAFAYTHLQKINHQSAYYNFYDNETGSDSYYTLPDGVGDAKLSGSFRIFGYFNVLSVFHSETLKNWRLDAGVGAGFWQGINNHYTYEEGKVQGLILRSGKGFNAYGRIHLQYERDLWQFGLTGGLDNDALEEPIAFLTFNIGIHVPVKSKER